MNKFILVFICFLLLLSIGCGGGSSNTTPPPPPPPPPSTVSANVAVDSTTNGPFDLAMSTSFQPAEWDFQFFQLNPGAVTPLGNLLPSHIRLQTVSKGVPQVDANTWDFSILDAITQPVLTVGDHSPEMQLGWAPTFMWSNGSSGGTLDVNAFSTYTQNMVKYYNTVSGFSATDGNHVSPSGMPIQYWGILNEPSINNIPDAATYTQIYNQVVPAMQSVDPTIKFVALELCCGTENWVQTFAQDVTARVDVVATHYYALCGPPSSSNDAQVFSAVPGFASSVQTIYANLTANPALSNVPVWITENNVNANFNSNGSNACGGGTFVLDQRGSSAFFAAWRPYVFSQVGKAGAQLLHHWDFDADAQYGEVNWPGNNQYQLQLSYWVDYWLARYFPGGSGQQLLSYTNSNNTQVEILPAKNTDGSVVIMVSNHAVASPGDNNGKGLTANVSVDTSVLGSFTSASELVIDSTTSASTGPTASSISASSPIALTMNGYSVAFIKLTP
jgi:hypothetical protein